ncbi:hypothetical protein J437_LFUL000849 [Ladona fulva]|uniref:Uncharacterized protein n=1 Tax=Ladona fulva TaxID=123851 RepID=A0A8K0NUU3_LADFU|nr:hypothetical protein J437_LFUL000849 [Ladona fulva]
MAFSSSKGYFLLPPPPPLPPPPTPIPAASNSKSLPLEGRTLAPLNPDRPKPWRDPNRLAPRLPAVAPRVPPPAPCKPLQSLIPFPPRRWECSL